MSKYLTALFCIPFLAYSIQSTAFNFQAPLHQQEMLLLHNKFIAQYKSILSNIKDENAWNTPGRETTHNHFFNTVETIIKGMETDSEFRRNFLNIRKESNLQKDSLDFPIIEFSDGQFKSLLQQRIKEFNFLIRYTQNFLKLPDTLQDVDLSRRILERGSSLPFSTLAKIQRAIEDTGLLKKYQKIVVSGAKNRCWLRSAWIALLEESFHNESFYQRLLFKIKQSAGEFDIKKQAYYWSYWVKKLKTMDERERWDVYNSQDFDEALSLYGRQMAYHLAGKNRDILNPDSAGSAYDSRSFFVYFNINVLQISLYGDEVSAPNYILGDAINAETILSEQYVLYGVPGHWNLLKKPY